MAFTVIENREFDPLNREVGDRKLIPSAVLEWHLEFPVGFVPKNEPERGLWERIRSPEPPTELIDMPRILLLGQRLWRVLCAEFAQVGGVFPQLLVLGGHWRELAGWQGIAVHVYCHVGHGCVDGSL